MQLQTLETIPCDIRPSLDGNCQVTFTIPETEINAFVMMLNGLSSLFKSLAWKQKTNIDAIHMRNEAKAAQIEAYQREYETAVCETYSEYFKREQNSRVAFSLTVSKIKNRFENSSYDNVKKCLTKNKLLKKTGFYSSRYKIE